MISNKIGEKSRSVKLKPPIGGSRSLSESLRLNRIINGWFVRERITETQNSAVAVFGRGVNRMVRYDSIRYRFSYPAIQYLPIPRKILRYDFDTISILIPSDTILLIPRKILRYDSIRYRFSYSAIQYLPIPRKILRYDSIEYRFSYPAIWYLPIPRKILRLRFDMILILIPSDTILAKILRYDYDLIQYRFSYPAIQYLLIPRKILWFDTISILIPSDTIFADTSKNYTIRLRFDTISILIPSDMIFADTSGNYTIRYRFSYPAIRYLPIPQKMLRYIRYDIDSYTQRYDICQYLKKCYDIYDTILILIPSDTIFPDTSKNYTIRFDTITILIPSDTIFADTSKNYTIYYDAIRYLPITWKIIRYDYNSIQEYIDLYIDIMILYTYFKQPSTFLLTHKCNQKYITWR